MKNTPSFWYPKDRSLSLKAFLLWPFTWVWRLGALLRKRLASPYHPTTPTIVIGNITAGGTGKTPYVAALAEAALKSGKMPVILTRGYGGAIVGPHRATDDDTAEQIGDEAKWLSQNIPVVVAHDRGQGAKWIDTTIPDCDLIIMDDGLQNPGIIPHIRIAVFNGKLGIGNGLVIPSGPLREPVSALKQYDAIVITGDDKKGIAAQARAIRHDIPVFMAKRHLNKKDVSRFNDKNVIAFAGIGDPDGFFAMLRSEGINLVTARSFPDHHAFTDHEIQQLKTEAKANNTVLVTTEKDMMRLTSTQLNGIQSVSLVTVIDPSFMDILLKAKV